MSKMCRIPSIAQFKKMQCKAKEGEDFWVAVYNSMFGTRKKTLKPETRQRLKRFYHGLSYGFEGKIGDV